METYAVPTNDEIAGNGGSTPPSEPARAEPAPAVVRPTAAHLTADQLRAAITDLGGRATTEEVARRLEEKGITAPARLIRFVAHMEGIPRRSDQGTDSYEVVPQPD